MKTEKRHDREKRKKCKSQGKTWRNRHKWDKGDEQRQRHIHRLKA